MRTRDDPAVPAAPAPEGSTGRRLPRHSRTLEFAAVVLVAIVLVLGVRSLALEAFYVPSGSMVPTLDVGDRIVVDKLLFNYHALHPGDIVVFRRPPDVAVCATADADLVKRVVATGGETIVSHGDAIYVDGHRLAQPYLRAGEPLGRPVPFQRVPAGDLFVMGDNRPESCDSRYFGPVAGSSVVGRVVAIVWRNGHPELHLF